MASGTLAPTCAWVEGGGGGTPGFQPVTNPASESKMNRAGPLEVPDWTTNPGVGLKTCPVGAPPGMLTTSPAFWIGLPLTKPGRSEEHTSELQSRPHLVCRLLLEKKKTNTKPILLYKKKKKKKKKK